MTMEPESGLWAAIGALGCHIVNRIVTYHQKKVDIKQKNVEINHDDLSELRRELKERCDKLQTDNDHWRNKYYSDMNELKEQVYNLKADNSALKIQLMDMKSRGWVPQDQQERYQ